MHKHRDLYTIETLLVEREWVIQAGHDSIASQNCAKVLVPQGSGFDTSVESLVENHDRATFFYDEADVLGVNVDEKNRML